MGEVLREVNERGCRVAEFPVGPAALAGLLSLIGVKTITRNIAKEVFALMVETGKGADAIVKEKNLVQITDRAALETLVDEAIAGNEKVVAQIRDGKVKAKGFLVGQVMKATKGKANPQLVNEVLEERLGKLPGG